MSVVAVNEFLSRALLDEDFRHAFDADPERTLLDYDLTDEERSILLSRDPSLVGQVFWITIIFAMINENVVALQPFPDEATRLELQRRGDEIVGMTGDRTEAIKQMLVRMR